MTQQGILNGIDAVAVALGQDWRAIEASCLRTHTLPYQCLTLTPECGTVVCAAAVGLRHFRADEVAHHVACCVLHVACCMVYVACRALPRSDPPAAAVGPAATQRGFLLEHCTSHVARRMQAAAHSFAATCSSHYTSLSRYWTETDRDGSGVLCAELHMPITVGTKGGALQTHPAYRYGPAAPGPA